jgi:hypothetical protein
MRDFSRRGFQLRRASLETRVAYTGFLVLTALGLATFLALSVGRVGFSPAAIAIYYRGGDSEMSFPRTFWQLMEVSHFHLFSVPTVVLILAHLLIATPTSSRFRVALTSATFAGAFLEASGPWAVRYGSPACAYALLAGWALLGAGSAFIIVVTLLSMWGPDGSLGPGSPAPEGTSPATAGGGEE